MCCLGIALVSLQSNHQLDVSLWPMMFNLGFTSVSIWITSFSWIDYDLICSPIHDAMIGRKIPCFCSGLCMSYNYVDFIWLSSLWVMPVLLRDVSMCWYLPYYYLKRLCIEAFWTNVTLKFLGITLSSCQSYDIIYVFVETPLLFHFHGLRHYKFPFFQWGYLRWKCQWVHVTGYFIWL